MASEQTDQWQGLVSTADWQALADALSEHVLHDLRLILSACDAVEVRAEIVTEVLQAAPEFGDRAVIVALARVAYDNDGTGRVGGSEATS